MFRKIITILSSISIGTSAILSSTASIKQESYIKNTKFKNLSTNANSNIQSGDFLYAPNIKVNSISDNPLGNNLNLTDEGNYYDFVFLKSIKWDDNNKTLNSSIDNIKEKDFSLQETLDENQDILDYQKMETLKDDNGNLAIQEGMSLVNRYLNNGLLSCNLEGDIPSRNTYFTSLLSDNVSLQSQQTVITNNFDSKTQIYAFKLSDYLSMNLHWYGIDLDLKSKLVSPMLVSMINDALEDAQTIDSRKTVDDLMESLSKFLKKKMFSFSERIMLEIDEDLVEDPEIIAILDPIYTVLAKIISDKIGDALKDALKETVSLPDGTLKYLQSFFQQIVDKVTNSLDPKAIGFDIETNIHWLIWNSKFALKPVIPKNPLPDVKIPKNPPLVFKNTANILTGTTNDFTLIMNSGSWSDLFLGGVQEGEVNNNFKVAKLYNSNIILEESDWKNILFLLKTKVGTWNIIGKYAICLHVIKKDNNFEISYTNLNKDGATSMPYNPKDNINLKISLIGYIDNNNLLITSSQFRSLLDSYDFANNNWNDIVHSKQNPDSYTNYKDWFYHTYIACDSSYIKSDASIWKDSNLKTEDIENLFDKYYQNFHLPNTNKKLDLSSFVSNTTDNTNQILDISNIDL